MKTKHKFELPLLGILVIAISTFAIILSTNSFIATAEAKASQISTMDTDAVIIADEITAIEQSLLKKGTSVENEIQRQMDDLSELLIISESKAEAEKIQRLIITSEIMLADYSAYKSSLLQKDNSIPPDLLLFYNAVISAIVSDFTSNNEVLSAELITHARDSSTILNSDYIPVYGSNVVGSSKFMSLISDSTKICGTDNFPGGASSIEQDMLHALGYFNYNKSYRNSSSITFGISDKYDFAPTNDLYDIWTAAGIGAALCYDAQGWGILTPFYTVILQQVIGPGYAPKTINFDSNHMYVEELPVLSASGYMEFNIKFATGGNKIIQTFGAKDAYLHLYDASGTQIASNDDSGLNLNAFINYNFTANLQYRVKVRFYSSSVVGAIKVGFLPTHSTTLTAYTSITLPMNGTYTSYTSTAQNNVQLFRFKPQTTAQYTITATALSSEHMKLYVTKAGSVMFCVESKNTSGQASISVDFNANDEYLIIVCRNPVYSAGVFFGLTIS